jgi:hypothetical protein
MAKSASKKFVAFLTLLHAGSLIVSTPMLHHFIFFLCSIFISFDFFTLFTFRRFFLFLNLLFTFFTFYDLIFSALLFIIFPSIIDVNLHLISPLFLFPLRWLVLFLI